MNIRDMHKSKTVRGIIIGLAIAAAVLFIFHLGMLVGYHKARFSGRFGDSFDRNFRDPRMQPSFLRGSLDETDVPGGHGAVGEIVAISLPQIVVAGPDNLEKTVLIDDSTRVREFQDEIAAQELQVGDYVVVLGMPNDDGQIEAKLIRLTTRPADQDQAINP